MPNNKPDTDVKSTVESTLKKDDKPKKDWWDKADIVGKFLIALITAIAAVVIPIVVAKIGGQVQKVLTTRQTGKDYMQIALGILEKKDLPAEMQKNTGLRKWAVSLLKYYSPVALDDDTAHKLVNGEIELAITTNAPEGQLEWGPPDPNFPFQATAFHDRGFASLNTDGILKVRARIRYTTQTQILSPKGLFFSRDGNALVVFNNEAFALYPTEEAGTGRGLSRAKGPINVYPVNGILNIWAAKNSESVVIKGKDNKEVFYDLDGKEIAPIDDR